MPTRRSPMQWLAEHLRRFSLSCIQRRRNSKPEHPHVITQVECVQGEGALPAMRCPYLTEDGECNTFRCAKCQRTYPWCQGANDNHPDWCDHCWSDD
jgi:hypothetical protein